MSRVDTQQGISRYCPIDAPGEGRMKMAITKTGLSAPAFDGILKISCTIADPAGDGQNQRAHHGEAIQYKRWMEICRNNNMRDKG